MWRARRRTNGDFDADAIYVANSLYGSGWGAAPGQHIGVPAAGCSGMGGTLRAGEFKNGIRHALAAALPYSKLKRGPVWPATSEDNVSDRYGGAVPIGTLVAIPQGSVSQALINSLSPEGRALYNALVQYGMYIIDTSGSSQSFGLSAEPAVAGELGSAIADLERLSPYLRAVTNNASGSGPVGGGTPLAPFAPLLQ
jgi:hypothetical protein